MSEEKFEDGINKFADKDYVGSKESFNVGIVDKKKAFFEEKLGFELPAETFIPSKEENND